MKILIACGVTFELLRDYEWDVIELSPHEYHCIGVHPIGKRIGIVKQNIFIH